MATGVLPQARLAEFQRLVRRWDRGLRRQQILIWLPRCLLPGLGVGILIGLISRLRPWLLGSQILAVTGVLLLIGLIVMALAVWIWPRSQIAAARRFDVLFNMRERVSTAFELMDGRIHTNNELTILQINDAWETAQSVQPRQYLTLVWNRQEWGMVAGMALLVVAFALLPNPQAQAAAEKSAQETALDNAREELQAITQQVAADPALSPEEREQLLEALQASSEALREPELTTEEAFATLTDAKATLQNQADQMSDQQQAQQAALDAANESLQDFQTEAAAESQQGDQAEAIPLLNELAQQLQNMSPEQQQALAQALQRAAQDLQQTNPQAAQALEQAAQQLREGNQSAAQEALQQAVDQLQQDAQSTQTQQSSAQQLSQSAQDIQNAANELSEQSGQNQQGQQGQQQQAQAQQNQQSGQQGQQGQDGQQGQSSQAQPQSQQGQQGQQGQTGQDGQSGQSGQQGQTGQGGQEGQASLQVQGGQNGQQGDSALEGGTSGGAGDQQGGAASDISSAQQSGQGPQTNAPDGQGQGQFDSIYAPQRIGGSAGPEIQLDPNSSNSPIEEGNFSANPTGDVTVPYNQVFNDYSNAANQALQSDYIPLGLRDVVRDYFSSLEPGQNGNSGASNPGSGR